MRGALLLAGRRRRCDIMVRMSDSADFGLPRRERRLRGQSNPVGSSESSASSDMDVLFGSDVAAPRTERRRIPVDGSNEPPTGGRRRRWRWVLVSILVLLALIAAGAFLAKRVYDQALVARGHLVNAMPFAAQMQQALLSADAAGAEAAAQSFTAEAELAAAATNGRAWGVLAGVPLPPFENLRAVDTVSDIAVSLGHEVLIPAASFQLSSLAPSGGKVDVAALQGLAKQMTEISAAVDEARADLAAIDRGALIGPVSDGMTDVETSLDQIHAAVAPAQDVLSVLPAALGATEPRNYLLMFQGNAEVRASGGGPGSFILLRADNGALTIAREAAATEFDIALPEPIIPLDAETEAVYSDIIGRWVANLTGTPDFPTSAALAQGWWQSEFGDQVDGVISLDPVALSYLLRATGPLSLPTGETLTSENAVPLLLNEAYFAYPTGVESNLFFAGAAAAVFDGLTKGTPDPVSLIAALGQAGEEGRLKIWTADSKATELLGTSPLSGILPRANDTESAIGVFFNDTTGSKMDYYVDASVSVATDQCRAVAEPTWTTTVSLANSISAEAAADLPSYITGPYYEPGLIATDLIIYSPVGATIDSWTIDGKEHPAAAHTSHLGRDVVRVAVTTPPSSTTTLEVAMTGAPGTTAADYGDLDVRHTPMVRATPITIEADGCE